MQEMAGDCGDEGDLSSLVIKIRRNVTKTKKIIFQADVFAVYSVFFLLLKYMDELTVYLVLVS